MGFREYLKEIRPEAVYGDNEDKKSEEEIEYDFSELKTLWEYSPNGYCEYCKAAVYNDQGKCPDCNKLTKSKYHWHRG